MYILADWRASPGNWGQPAALARLIDATALAEAAWQAFADATESERVAYLASVRQPVELGDEADVPKLVVE